MMLRRSSLIQLRAHDGGDSRQIAVIRILGGGPAGSAAAIAALQHGAPVAVVEKSPFPRHKVCGEFLSPETAVVLNDLGVWGSFAALGPAKVRRMILTIGACVRRSSLPETAWGCSRYALDHLLFERAKSLGAVVSRAQLPRQPIDVLAVGRTHITERGRRTFGFKAHFRGPSDDAVELYFFDGCYIGVCPVEDGITSICGLAPEELLRRFDFDYDVLPSRCCPLAERIASFTRVTKWFSAGPLVFRHFFRNWPNPAVYPAGDALSFVDPFTGSGILSALLSGQLAGRAAARGTPVQDYLADCRRALSSPFQVATGLRTVLRFGLADKLAPLIPASWLFALTRPRGA
jgi:flavin-dependent dehydrogenase